MFNLVEYLWNKIYESIYWKVELSDDDKFLLALENIDCNDFFISDSRIKNWKVYTIFVWKKFAFTKVYLDITEVYSDITDSIFAYEQTTFWANLDEKLQKEISWEFYEKVRKLAESKSREAEIKSIWWYILDNDLRQAIEDTKKVMTASEQIENLTNVILNIRKKYGKTS